MFQDDNDLNPLIRIHITVRGLSPFLMNVKNRPKQQNGTLTHENKIISIFKLLLHTTFFKFLVVKLSCSVRNPVVSVICLRMTMNSVCFSPISVQPSTVLDDCWFKIEEFPNKMAIPSAQNARDKSFFLRKLTPSSASVLNIWSHYFLFCLLISVSHAQLHSSKVLLGSTSASLEFLHSLSFSTRSVQDATPEGVISLNAGALSLWHSLPQ